MIPTILPSTYVDNLTYAGNYPSFPQHGTVDLIDCIECYAEQTEDEGSEWEVAFTYPLGGYGFDQIQLNAIILAKVNDHQGLQAFRIYGIEKSINKTISVKCQHISYDMVNVPVKPFKATSCSDAITKIRTNTIYGNNWKTHHFYLDTDITSSEKFEPDTPTSMRAMLLDGDDSIKGTYGGDLIFDNYHVSLNQVGGADRGVTINYGVDLIDMTQEYNNSEMITGILPYYKRSTNDELYATDPIIYGDVVNGPGTYDIPKIKSVDLTEHFPNNVPTTAQVTAKAREWVAKEEIGIPEISLTVSYATLGQDVRIHDAVRVVFQKMGIDVKSKVVKYKYNVLLERCEEIEVGHAKESKYFSLMDASKLRKGLIPPERIQNESITGDKIASGGVGKGKIGPEAIGSGNIELQSINHELLSKKGSSAGPAVLQDVIGAGEVGEDEIDDGAVVEDKIDSGAVTENKIGRGAVVEDAISMAAVSFDKIKNYAVDTIKLAIGAVTEDNIDTGAVTEDKIDDEAVTEDKIGTEAVTFNKIGQLAVDTSRINDAAIAWAKLQSGSGQPATKINALEADMAYVNKLFASSAQINYIYANNASFSYMHSDSAGIGSATIISLNNYQIRWVNIDGTYCIGRA